MLTFANSLVVTYPAASSLRLFWNLGRFLGIVLALQIVTGIFLVFYFVSSHLLAFDSVDFIGREVFGGIFFRILHLNGASLFFFFLFLHLGRGLFYQSFKLEKTWLSGVTIILLVMGTAFLGYVLPWGQISFWGATVITNFISTIPICGGLIVLWVWGGFNVGGPTLTFFFALHYLLPFVVLVIVGLHLIFLHETGSTRPLVTNDPLLRVTFSPFFTSKDALNLVAILIFFSLVFFSPWRLGDPENWIPANPLVRPVHIQPEWYFLFAYAILRCIPNKLGGVIALVIRVTIFYGFVFFSFTKTVPSFAYYLNLRIFTISFLLLTWLGRCPVEDPYILLRQLGRLLYFLTISLKILL